jgi:hypothetical protein
VEMRIIPVTKFNKENRLVRSASQLLQQNFVARCVNPINMPSAANKAVML